MLEQKVLDYELYLRLVSADGIPRLIINDALPVIENEVNTVLDHMMAGFHLGITNEDKNINLYIRYDDQEWPLSLIGYGEVRLFSRTSCWFDQRF